MRLIDANELIKVKFHPMPYTHIVPVDLLEEQTEAYERGWNDAIDAIMECAETVEPQQWIPVTKRLPERHGKEYLVTVNDGSKYVTSAQYDVAHKQWYYSYYDKAVGERFRVLTDDIVAWRELPEPYNGVNK